MLYSTIRAVFVAIKKDKLIAIALAAVLKLNFFKLKPKLISFVE